MICYLNTLHKVLNYYDTIKNILKDFLNKNTNPGLICSARGDREHSSKSQTSSTIQLLKVCKRTKGENALQIL
jgi:hypothetical protein